MAEKFHTTYLKVGAALRGSYAGAAPRHNMNNCGLEGHNGVLKGWTGTCPALASFFLDAKKYLNNESMRRDTSLPEYIPFALKPTIPVATWKAAHLLRLQCKLTAAESTHQLHCVHESVGESAHIIISKDVYGTYFTGLEATKQAVVADIMDRFNGCSWSAMSDMHQFLSHTHVVTMHKSGVDWYCHCEGCVLLCVLLCVGTPGITYVNTSYVFK